MTNKLLFILIVASIVSCQRETPKEEESGPVVTELPEELPYKVISLQDLSEFANTGNNWSIVGAVSSDYQREHDLTPAPGTGVLANQPGTANNANIRTKWEHGDIELKFDVMVPKGSNSGVYLQGRYEVQLFDSWGKDNPEHSDMGGVYERWDEDRPEGKKGYDGVPPQTNAALAPGLWQHYHLLFRAPRFDPSGKKITNARFDFVYLNDQLIQQNVQVNGPTRAHHEEGETKEGPLYIQGDHGPIAFRNFQYKSYGLDTLAVTDLTYQVYDGKYDFIPNFDTLTPSSSGEVAYFNLQEVTDKSEGYCVVFNGDLQVPTDGEYLFETQIDDGGDLWIDSILVVHNQGEPGWGSQRGVVRLSKGTHNLKMTYYQEVWSATLLVFYEGPGISRRPLASFRKKEPWQLEMEKRPPLVLNELENPELLRGFIMYGDEKLTHAISVGDPTGIHYSYDLNKGSLVKGWKGAFGDVTDMWQGRGESQLLVPLSPSIALFPSFPVASLSGLDAAWPKDLAPDLKYAGYSIGKDQRPIFHYLYKGIQFDDKITPENGKLTRTITLENFEPNSIYIKLGEAPQITKLANGMFSFDGQYYLAPGGLDWKIRHQENRDELIALVNNNTISYKLIW